MTKLPKAAFRILLYMESALVFFFFSYFPIKCGQTTKRVSADVLLAPLEAFIEVDEETHVRRSGLSVVDVALLCSAYRFSFLGFVSVAWLKDVVQMFHFVISYFWDLLHNVLYKGSQVLDTEAGESIHSCAISSRYRSVVFPAGAAPDKQRKVLDFIHFNKNKPWSLFFFFPQASLIKQGQGWANGVLPVFQLARSVIAAREEGFAELGDAACTDPFYFLPERGGDQLWLEIKLTIRRGPCVLQNLKVLFTSQIHCLCKM